VKEFTGCWEGWMPNRPWLDELSLAWDEEFASTFDSWASV